METLEFTSSELFLQWARTVVKDKSPPYDRAPVGKQLWTYADGHRVPSNFGSRGGTLIKNLRYMIRIAKGLEHKRDTQLIGDIDNRGGVKLTIDWGEQSQNAEGDS